ncbi:FadR/GntR family transcriptional regulator [Phenylobacterium sp.]|jgi:DNA-binding FadR family transcriptional regulator|uniref:FadR/GntR family transcriptional regulator n=1 Tax=Phenylobacterium sp. TaxID=1871053 RepID=UPI002F408FD1
MKAKTSGGRTAGPARTAKAETAPRRLSAVYGAADALRRDAIDREDGDLLGAEEDLIRRYRVSRPTLRQAAALVCQENLLRVKRGVGGGYFASRPDSRAVAHMAAVYLRTRQTRVSEVIRAVEPIRIELAKLAAAGDNEAARDEMRQFLAGERATPDAQMRYRDFLRSEREFGRILGDMSGNKVISLFLLILYDFSGMLGRNEDLYINRPHRVSEYREKRNRLAEALIEGDAELAVVAAKRCAMNASEWLLEDLGAQSGGSAFLHLAGAPPEGDGTTARRPAKERKAAASRAGA